MWDLAVESDPSTLEWIRETHTAERDPMTMSGTVDPAASTVTENGESKDIPPENVGTKPIPSTANPAGLETEPKPALQIPQGQHCKSRTSGSANVAGPALQISQGCIYKDKTLHVNPPCKPNPSLPTGELPASGKRPAEKDGNDMTGTDSEAATVMEHLTSVRSRLTLTTAEPTRRDRAKIGNLVGRIAKAHGDDHAAAVALILAAIDWLPSNTYWLGRIDSARRLADNWDGIANDWTISQIERRRASDSEARDRDRKTKPVRNTRVPSRHEERHVHTFVCEHVLADMRPHEDEYDHEGSLRYGHPSEWQTACMEHADELNQRDGIEVTA